MKGARGADRVHLGTYRASYRLEYNDSNLSIYRKYKVFSDRCFCCLYKGFSVMLSGVFSGISRLSAKRFWVGLHRSTNLI